MKSFRIAILVIITMPSTILEIDQFCCTKRIHTNYPYVLGQTLNISYITSTSRFNIQDSTYAILGKLWSSTRNIQQFEETFRNGNLHLISSIFSMAFLTLLLSCSLVSIIIQYILYDVNCKISIFIKAEISTLVFPFNACKGKLYTKSILY